MKENQAPPFCTARSQQFWPTSTLELHHHTVSKFLRSDSGQLYDAVCQYAERGSQPARTGASEGFILQNAVLLTWLIAIDCMETEVYLRQFGAWSQSQGKLKMKKVLPNCQDHWCNLRVEEPMWFSPDRRKAVRPRPTIPSTSKH